MKFSIKKRIYWSFYILASLFVINGIVITLTLSSNQKLSRHISEITDPSLRLLYDFKQMLLQSEMYSSNWVFIRASENDKKALQKIHLSDYPILKKRLNSLTGNWHNQNMADSLKNLFSSFEELMQGEKYIMRGLEKFEDYDDPVKRFGAEDILTNEVLTHTNILMNSLGIILSQEQEERSAEERQLEDSSVYMRALILFLSVLIIGLAFFLSRYMGKIIIRPINGIICIVNDLGKGITSRINHFTKNDEIGEMIHSVNTLSEKLHSSALFANEIGNRNFNTEFAPLGEEDKLGKALIAMRDNLKSSDESLNEAQHIANMGSWERDFKHNKIFWSDELFRIFDAEPSSFDATYETYLNFIHPDDREHVNSFSLKYVQDHKPFSYECRILTQKGINKIICVQGKVIGDKQGEVIKTYGVVQDITQRKQAEEKLVQSEVRLKEAQAIAHTGNWEIDLTSNINTWSDEFYKIYGINRGEVQPSPELFLSFMHPDDAEFAQKKVQEAFATLNNSSMNFRFIRKDSAVRHGYTEWKFEIDKNGKPLRLFGIVQDITERKESEISLRQSEEQIKTIYNAVLDAVIIIDDKGKIVKWDSKSEALFGWKEDEVMGTLLSEKIIPHQNREAHERGMKHFLKTGVGPVLGKTIEVRALNKNNKEFDIALSISPSLVKDKYQFIGFVRDITSRKEAEKELKRNNEELKKSNHELDKFVYSVSHDLRAPLLSMQGVVDITEEATTEEMTSEHMKMLRGSITRLDNFIGEILEYSRNARLEVKNDVVDFKKLLKEITGNLQYMNGTANPVEIKVDYNGKGTLNSDNGRLSIVLNNLISNSIRYYNPKVEKPYVKIHVETDEKEARIEVEDNGIGINKEYHQKIFDMFYRVSEKSSGSGLGLYIVKETVDKLNGEILVESQPGTGTKFSLKIPNLFYQ